MKKRNLILTILVVIFLATFTVGAINGDKQAKAEKYLNSVITHFLEHDYIGDKSTQEVFYPEYIEISLLENRNFFIMFKADDYKMYYSTNMGEPLFFIENSNSSNNISKSLSADLFSICKRLQYNTCFLRTSSDTVLIQKVRIYNDGIIEAQDISGIWHQKISCNNFILA